MGWNFRKSKSLGKNSRLNIGKKSMGISTGIKGARISVNSKGRAGFSISAPGGFRYRKSFKIGGRWDCCRNIIFFPCFGMVDGIIHNMDIKMVLLSLVYDM